MVVHPFMLSMLGGASLLAVTACGASSGRLDPELAPDEAQVGYGTRPERDLTGAVTSLSDRELTAARPMRLEDLLRGRVAGLQFVRLPNGTTTIRIRGTNSLSNDREPLLIVDGIPVRGESLASALSGLLPEDIRRVDVLKDLASTSIYGMSGAGGVIIITTRR
jgi:TonB-dependent SusC/RagA subfamily outer membrane receptor